MAGQLAASMTADAPRDDDIPDRPVFVNLDSDEDEDEPAEPIKKAPAKAEPPKTRAPIVTTTVQTPTYRPAYVPPTTFQTPVQPKPVVQVDTSGVKAGTIVKHKAFGTGQVKGIDGGLIVVTFNGMDKKFQFPGAFEQGFLALE